MKKIILNMLLVIILPIAVTFAATFISPNLRLGMGSFSVKDHLLGKKILVETQGLYKDVDVEEYVVGVMAQTVPADYDMEALKTVAVLIRTNVLKEMEEQATNNEEDLSYQYLSKEERKKLWGKKNFQKIEGCYEQAVSSTAGQVIYYKNELIMACYHEVSIGKTASGKEILGEDIPYLQSVESSQDVEAKNYMNVKTVTMEEYNKLVKEKTEGKDRSIKIEESSKQGFVKRIRIGEKTYTGKEAMEQLGLPSANFYIEETKDGFRFVCLGKGDCLGVSLYGANQMAQKGSTYDEIIAHYYKDVHIKSAIDS